MRDDDDFAAAVDGFYAAFREERETEAARRAEAAARQPTCPKCGRPMVGGSPHGAGTIQWECRGCNVYLPAGR